MVATQALARNGELSLIEQALVVGDLSKLTSGERANYYAKVCESVGLNPLTRPFDYLTLNNKLILYARKDCTDQLRSLRTVTIAIVPQQVGDLYVVTARATLPNGRFDEEIGAVSTAGLRGDALANAMMKATTKAKRRVTLSICGLGMLDESEVETIPDARRHDEPEAAPDRRSEPEGPLTREPSPPGAFGIGAAEPAVMRADTEPPEDQAAEVAQLFDQPVPKLWPQVQRMVAQLDAAKLSYTLPPQTQDDSFIADWLTRQQAELDKVRRAQNAQGRGR